MKNFILVLVSLISLSLTSFAQDKASKDFLVTNGTGLTIVDVYASPSTKNMWGDNLISENMTAESDAYRLSIPVTTTDCAWDFKFHDDKGNEYVMNNVDLCTSNTFILVKDDKSKKEKE